MGVLALAGGTGAAALVDAVGEAAADARVGAEHVELDGVPVEDGLGAEGGAPADGTAARTEGGAPSSAATSPGADPDAELVGSTSAAVRSAAPPEADPARPVVVPLPDGMTPDDVAAGLLSLAVPASAGGDLIVVPGSEPAPLPERTVRTVRVEVEAGLEVDGPLFAGMVMDTLNDPRSWGAEGEVTFARTDGDADLRVVLASPQKIDEMCAPLETRGIYSCGAYGHAALNHMRWVQGTDEFTDLTQYRQYLVNHEVGHLLDRRHEDCPGAGQVAPVMQQQTIRVAPCLPNAWPYPDAS